MNGLREAACRLLDASVHVVHCMNSWRIGPGLPDSVYVRHLAEGMDALEMTINECGPALSSPDVRVPSVEARIREAEQIEQRAGRIIEQAKIRAAEGGWVDAEYLDAIAHEALHVAAFLRGMTDRP